MRRTLRQISSLGCLTLATMLFASCGTEQKKEVTPTEKTETVEVQTVAPVEPEPSEDASLSDSEIDSMLDSYEDYTDKYIKFYKKAMNGDADALSEYPALMENAEEFANKLEAAEGDLNGDQLARMMEIQQKMMNAMSGN